VPVTGRRSHDEFAADVVVVGGGPAGAAAAITLARAGRDVVLVEKARFPREKCCGDGLTTAALRHLEALGLDPGAVPSWQVVEDVCVRSPSGRAVEFPLPRGRGIYAAVARRSELDAAVVDVARRFGVRVLEGHGVHAARRDGDAVGVDVEGMGTVRARYAVGADGIWSPLRKALGSPNGSQAGDGGARGTGYLGEWHAFRQYLTGVDGDGRQLWVWFEPDLLPGYAWSFPLAGGRANVGFGLPRANGRPARELGRVLADVLARPHVRAVLGPRARPEAPHRAWPIPARVGSTSLSAAGGRALFVGDAARAPDPMTGEGIAQALETGILAARAIVAAGPHRPERASAAYEAAIRRGLVLDNGLAALLSRALSHGKGARGAVRLAGATAWTRRNFARWLFEDYPRAMLATPHRWHRGMLGGPGAYRGGSYRAAA
jgi:geranylgeranyl reductase family protein